MVVAADWRPILRPTGCRAEEVHLGREELACIDVPLRQSDGSLDVERRNDLAMEHEISENRKVLLDGRLDDISEVLAFGVPVPILQLVR